jgi:hypothetical protein
MSIITRVELAQHIGKPTNYLSVYIKRGKLIEVDGKIDLENIVNKRFLARQTHKLEKLPQNITKAVESFKHEEKERKEIVTQKINKENQKTKKQMNVFALDEEKKQKEIEKLTVDIQIKELQFRKMEGELLPFEIVKELVSQMAKHLISEFDNATDNILTRISTQTKMSASLISECREFMKLENNLAQKKAMDLTKKSMEAVIKEMKE